MQDLPALASLSAFRSLHIAADGVRMMREDLVPVEMPVLHHLYINEPSLLARLMKAATLPVLKTLIITDHVGSETDNDDDKLNCISRLTSLEVLHL